MNETHVTVTGNVATQVDFKKSASGAWVARFRLASTVRRYDQQQAGWADAYTSFYTVWSWRSLAGNVASSLTIGEPVIVTGALRVRETDREGRRYVSADLTAATIGHDLTRGTAAFARVATARPDLVPPPPRPGGEGDPRDTAESGGGGAEGNVPAPLRAS